MTPSLIWDLPIRLFHWLLAAGFLAAAGIALLLGDDNVLFPYHAIIGLTLACMVVLRILWGLVGTRYARFTSFIFSPASVLTYMKGVATGTGTRHLGHNPGSAYAIFAMLALILTLAVTGVMMSQGNEAVEEIHELSAYAMLAVVAAHIIGVAVHTLRHRENITASMIHGRKPADQADAIASPRPATAALFLLITGTWALALARNYDPAKQSTTLPLLGTTLQLGEADTEGKDNSPASETDDDDD